MRVALLLRQVSTQQTLLLVGGFALLVLLQNGAAQLVLVALLGGYRLSLQGGEPCVDCAVISLLKMKGCAAEYRSWSCPDRYAAECSGHHSFHDWNGCQAAASRGLSTDRPASKVQGQMGPISTCWTDVQSLGSMGSMRSVSAAQAGSLHRGSSAHLDALRLPAVPLQGGSALLLLHVRLCHGLTGCHLRLRGRQLRLQPRRQGAQAEGGLAQDIAHAQSCCLLRAQPCTGSSRNASELQAVPQRYCMPTRDGAVLKAANAPPHGARL